MQGRRSGRLQIRRNKCRAIVCPFPSSRREQASRHHRLPRDFLNEPMTILQLSTLPEKHAGAGFTNGGASAVPGGAEGSIFRTDNADSIVLVLVVVFFVIVLVILVLVLVGV